MTQVTFTRSKDGHRRGDTLELDRGDWRVAYWLKKGCICICDREADLEVVTQDPMQEPKQKRRRRRK